MAQTIYIKNSAVTGVEPTSLGKGEIAINISDGNLFYGDAGGNVSQNFSFINSGVTSIGPLTATSGTFRSNVNISGDTHFPDNGKAIFGAGEDLKIYHSGSHSIIQDAGIGDLQIKGSTVKIRGTSVSEDCAVFTENGSVELYYDNVKKFETHSDGIVISSLTATSGTFNNNLNVSGDTQIAGVTKLASSVLTTTDINAGTIDGASINTCEISTSDITVGAGKTLELREAGAFNTSLEQNMNIIQGAASNLDIGAYTMRASTFYADVSTGTAPFTIESTTVVPNLHVASATSVMTNANLTGDITSVGNATSIASGVIINADVKSDAAIDYSKLDLSDGNILVGNGSNVATSVNPSGDIDVSNAGVFSIASGVVINADVKSDAAIDYSKLAALSDGNILIGNGSNVATSVNPSGDIDVTNAGLFSIASGVIINADVKSDAAIAQTKLDTNVDLGGSITFGNQSDDVVTFTGPLSSNTRFSGTQHLLRNSGIYINSAAFVQNSLYMGNSSGNQPFNWNDPQAAGGVLSETDSISISEDDMKWASILPFDISKVDIQCSLRAGGVCTGDDFFIGLYTATRQDCNASANMTITKVADSQDLLCQGKYVTNDFEYTADLDKGTLIFIGIGTETASSAAKNGAGILNVTITQR